MSKFIITIDGPAASGKGSLSKKISEDFNLYYMETGIYYRGFASLFYKNKRNNFDLSNFISDLDVKDFKEYLINNKKLYSTEITKLASKLAKIVQVRLFIVKMQQEAITNLDQGFNGIILEGRDCGTVVAPEADLKFYLTSNLKIRAKRRFNQFVKEKKDISFKQVIDDLIARDKQDENREHSPLRIPKDAVVVDNSNYDFEATINIVKNIIFSRIPSLKYKINILKVGKHE